MKEPPHRLRRRALLNQARNNQNNRASHEGSNQEQVPVPPQKRKHVADPVNDDPQSRIEEEEQIRRKTQLEAGLAAQAAFLNRIQQDAQQGPLRSRKLAQEALKNRPKEELPSIFLHERTEALEPSLNHPRTPFEQENDILFVQDIGKQYQLAVKDTQIRVRDNNIKSKDAWIAELQGWVGQMRDEISSLQAINYDQAQSLEDKARTIQKYEERLAHQASLLELNRMKLKNYEKTIQSSNTAIQEKDLGIETLRTQLERAQKDIEELKKRDLWSLFSDYINRQQSSKRTFPFLKLSGEIRNMIYKECLVLPRPIDLWPIIPLDLPRGMRDCYRMHLILLSQDLRRLNPAVLRVCRQIHGEATPIFYGHNRFRFSDRGGWTVLDGFLRHIGPNVNFLTSISVTCPEWAVTVIEATSALEVADGRMKDEMRELLSRFDRSMTLDAPNGPSSSSINAFKHAGDILIQLRNLQRFSVVIAHDMLVNNSNVDALTRILTQHDRYLRPMNTSFGWKPACNPKRSVVFIRRDSQLPAWKEGRSLDDDLFMGRTLLKDCITRTAGKNRVFASDSELGFTTAEYGSWLNRMSYFVDGDDDKRDLVVPQFKDYMIFSGRRQRASTVAETFQAGMTLMVLIYMFNSFKGPAAHLYRAFMG